MPYRESMTANNLSSGISYNAVGCKFNVNEPTIRHIWKKEEEICQSLHEAALESANVIAILYIEALKRWLNLWIHEMITN